jgi:hypothetical protein
MDIYTPQPNPVAVVVTMDRKEVRVGPYPTSEKGGAAATYLRNHAQKTLSLSRAEVVLTGYNPAVPHLEAELPTARDLLAQVLDSDPGTWPDVYARLAAWHGESAASRLYTAARAWKGQRGRSASSRR